MKKISICLLTVLFLLLNTGCSSEKVGSKGVLEDIQKKGYIVISTEGMWRPWTYHDDDDILTGFDVELGKLIAEKLGVEAVFVESEFNAGLASVDSGRSDIMINGIDITEERLEKYNFSDPYCYNHTALIVRKDNTTINGFEDLVGKTTANTLQSTYAALAESYGATVTGVNSFADTIQLLTTNRIDATLNDQMSYVDYITSNPDAAIKVVALTEEATNVAIPMIKDSSTDTLREAINKALSELRADGTLVELSNKFFSMDITQKN